MGKINIKYYILCFLLLLPILMRSQNHHDTEWADTLSASVKTEQRIIIRRFGEMTASKEAIKAIISPLGEGDAIRWAQALPGVSTGADGGTAYFVRGADSGANLSTIDGVPIYGFSHILGLATILPSNIIDEVSFVKSGIHGSENNFTASHLKIKTKSIASERLQYSFAANNFLVGAGLEGHFHDNAYLLFSARISPLTLEYKSAKAISPTFANSISNLYADVWDIYAKTAYVFNNKSNLAASVLWSNDSYSFDFDKDLQKIGWKNLATALSYTLNISNTNINTKLAYVDYSTLQGMSAHFSHLPSDALDLSSSLSEAFISFDFHTKFCEKFDLDYGAKLNHARFAYGSPSELYITPTIMTNLYAQIEWRPFHFLESRAFARLTYFNNLLANQTYITPDYSASAKLIICPELSLEASYDHLNRYYHCLEGLPVGWSLDMRLPSDDILKPEKSDQISATFLFKKGKQCASLGFYNKAMSNLVYNKHVQNLFSSVLTEWRAGLDIGKGHSYGIECLYEYAGNDFYSRFSYTWSRTNRYGFASINNGQSFHARYDREHILNANFRWKNISLNFIYQSGNWESAAPNEYIIPTESGDRIAQYFVGVNDYHMPAIMRLDLSYSLYFKSGRLERLKHDLNIGVCNVLNHFNPFMLYYDSNNSTWKMLAMLPIMPNLSYTLSF